MGCWQNFASNSGKGHDMYSTELIRKFPKDPVQPILFVVYNNKMVDDARFLIRTIWGEEYLNKHVTVTSYNKTGDFDRKMDYQVYIDPMVFRYKAQWFD